MQGAASRDAPSPFLSLAHEAGRAAPAGWNQRREAVDQLRENGFECNVHPDGTQRKEREPRNDSIHSYVAPLSTYVDMLTK